MAISRFSTSSVAQGLPKYQKLWDGTSAVFDSDYELIERVTTTGSPVTFSSIPQTYRHLQLRVIGKNDNTTYSSVYWTVRFNGDTGNNYNCHSLYGNGSSAATMYNGTYTSEMIAGEIVASGGGMASQNSSPLILDVLDYTNTNKNKVMRSLAGFDGNGVGTIRLSSGLWMNTAAITSLSIMQGNAGVFSAGLYGIKGAA